MIVYFLFQILLICVCSRNVDSRHAAAKKHGVFYITGSDGIYVIDPQKSYLEAKITNTSSPGLCTRSNNSFSKSDCSFSNPCVVSESLYLADAPGSAVKVIDLDTQKKTETIITDPAPYGLYNVPWRKEVWVHSWTNGTFDVINTESRTRTHRAVRAHIKPGWTHGVMLAQRNLLDGNVGYVTHLWNPGVHSIDLKTKSYSGFINMTSQGCIGTYGIVYSPVNEHLFVQCYRKKRGNTIIQIQVPNGNIKNTWNILGSLFASPNGRYVVMLYAPVNRTTDQLLDNRMNVLELNGTHILKHPELHIPGGVSRIVFYAKTSGSYYAFVTLKYASKIAVVDLDLVKNGNLSVTYIDDVGESKTTGHATSRGIFSGGKWIVSPASKSRTVVIIDADTRTVHGKVENVNGGGFAAWVETNDGVSVLSVAHKMVLGVGILAVFFFMDKM